MEFTNVSVSDLPKVARAIIELTQHCKLVAFYGQMGAGKTTLIKEICALLQVQEQVSSPTFGLVNEYTTPNHQTLYHFDFYRIKQLEEVYDIGYEDYFYSGNICLIEWPEMIEALLANEHLIQVELHINPDQSRKITIEEVRG